jgi:hypothetical protein
MSNHPPMCQQCRSSNIELIEIWDASISWYLEEDKYFNDGQLVPGDPLRVEGHCLRCEHRWRLRGVTQVQKHWFAKE